MAVLSIQCLQLKAGVDVMLPHSSSSTGFRKRLFATVLLMTVSSSGPDIFQVSWDTRSARTRTLQKCGPEL